jgi:sugar phosphate isomerase/epimerase
MKEADLSFIEWGSDIHAPFDDTEKLYEIAEMQREYSVKCSSYGTYFRLGETPIEDLERYIRGAKILGTDILRLWCASKSGDNMTSEEREELFSACREAATLAEKENVKLCMECHKNTFTENPDDSVSLMKSVNSPSFRMYWQPFQWQNTDENIANAKKIAPFAEHIHVFNWVGDKKLPLAEGVEKWQEYLKEFTAPLTLLLEFMPNGTLEELKNEAATLKTIVGENI